MSDLHLSVVGAGIPAVFVHGSFGWGEDTFPEQRALSDEYRVVLVDRRGFGGSTFAEADGWPTDMHDLAELLDAIGPAHLVGQSYGTVVALLAAGLRPDRIRSLVAIEPPAFELAAGDTAADRKTLELKPVFERSQTMTAQEFIAAWGLAQGRTQEQLEAWTGSFGEQDWAAVEASRLERWPGDAPFQFDVLRAAAFPKLLVRGAWKPQVAGREGAGKDFAAVCRRLAKQIGARLVVFEHSTHNPQLQEPDAFNALLRETWAIAARSL